MAGVLVLDNTYNPIGVADLEQAVCYLLEKKAFALPGCSIIATYRSPTISVPIPKVIVLTIYVEVSKWQSRVVTNALLFARDNWTCQYCGRHKRDLAPGEKLTRDHVKPVSRFPGSRSEQMAAANVWDNVTTSCSPCNSHKGDRLPMECGMMPKTTPKRPHGVAITVIDKLDTEQIAILTLIKEAIAGRISWDELFADELAVA